MLSPFTLNTTGITAEILSVLFLAITNTHFVVNTHVGKHSDWHFTETYCGLSDKYNGIKIS